MKNHVRSAGQKTKMIGISQKTNWVNLSVRLVKLKMKVLFEIWQVSPFYR